MNFIGDQFESPASKVAANDLLYCPRLYRSMQNKEQEKPVTVMPCECGHAEVVSGHQRACIAARTGQPVAVQVVPDKEDPPFCSLCDGQITFESKNTGGIRIVTVKAVIEAPSEEE